jgi:hypothetical protein
MIAERAGASQFSLLILDEVFGSLASRAGNCGRAAAPLQGPLREVISSRNRERARGLDRVIIVRYDEEPALARRSETDGRDGLERLPARSRAAAGDAREAAVAAVSAVAPAPW